MRTIRLRSGRWPFSASRSGSSSSPGSTGGTGSRAEPSGLQLDVPVEIVAPALVEVIGREGAAVLLQLPAGRPERAAVDVHVRLLRRSAALAQVAGGAGGGDILPGRPPALGARDDVIEGQLPQVAAILALEAVAKEQVEPGEGRMLGGADILAKRDDARQPHREARGMNLALIGGDDVHPLQKDRLDGGLPRPQAQRVVTQRRVVGVEHEGWAAFGVSEKVGMVQGRKAPVFRKNIRKTPSRTCRTQKRKNGLPGRPLQSRHRLAEPGDAVMTP